jgi:indole-3-glycerol phosphate synthase
MSFIKTDTILDKILATKVVEIARRSNFVSFGAMRRLAEQSVFPVRNFAQALQKDTVALIAEVKKASPSKGILVENFDPIAIASTYAQNGASAISVLTDEEFFQGHLEYLQDIRQHVSVPLLRKDFVVSPYQVHEARASGADAVLLIVAALDDNQLRDLRAEIEAHGMTALVEVHDESETERALASGASVIGINNRNLHNFQVSLDVTARLAKLVPDSVTLVAESGIMAVADVQTMAQHGAHAILVGESLVKKGGDMAESVRQFSSVSRKVTL